MAIPPASLTSKKNGRPAPPAKTSTKRRPMLVAKGVVKDFMVGHEPYHAVRGISTEIFDGEFVIIFGPSGSGKSTFLNMLIGLEPPTSGQVWVDGIEIDKMSDDQRGELRATKFGVVAQQPIWVKALTVRENTAMPLIILNAREHDAFVKADVALYRVGLSSHMLHKPTELSGGQQQRVNLARALVNNPQILVLDEPTGNLDSKSSFQVLDLLEQMNKERRRTILMVTHNMEYLPLADHLIEIHDGKIFRDTPQTSKALRAAIPEPKDEEDDVKPAATKKEEVKK